jgi:hypothetical protein
VLSIAATCPWLIPDATAAASRELPGRIATCPWEQAAECREDRPICWSIPHAPVELAFENTNLMSEHHDLNVFVRLASPTRHNKAEDAAQADVGQGEGHGGSWPDGDAQCQSRGLIVVLVPFILGSYCVPQCPPGS